VGKHRTDIDFLSVIVNRSNSANFVSTHVKHRKFTDSVGSWEDGAKLGKVGKVAFFHTIKYQRASADLISGNFSVNSFNRFRVITCTGI
jgi:hypothetical protein